MSPKIHREIYTIKPDSLAIPVERPGIGPDPNISTIQGPVPTIPKIDSNISVPVLNQTKGKNQSGNG